jgi:hypothetical protein
LAMGRITFAIAVWASVQGWGCSPRPPRSEDIWHEAGRTDQMIWTGVAAIEDGRIFVSAPRWAGLNSPAVAVLDSNNALRAYPDEAWNGWQPGKDPRTAFVSVNALHRRGATELWVVDTGTPGFGKPTLQGGPKLVRIDLQANAVLRVYPLGPSVAKANSYVDDIRFHGTHAYLTDAGSAGIIVLDIESGNARRLLDGDPSTSARPDRPIVVDGAVLRGPDGAPLGVNADPLEVSPDGKWLYFAPLSGPWSRVETRWLDDPTVDSATVARHVESWFDLPAVGGTAMDAAGNLYFSDLATDSIKKLTPDRRVETILSDPRMHWVDAPYLDNNGWLWAPAAQLNRVGLFNGGRSHIEWPVRLYKIRIDARN